MITGIKNASWSGDNRDTICGFINSNLPEKLADKIEAIKNGNGQLEFKDLDGNTLIEINNPSSDKYSATIKNSSGTVGTANQAEAYSAGTRKVTALICDNGILIDFIIDNDHFLEIFSIDNNDNLVYGCVTEIKNYNFTGFYSTAYDSASLRTDAGSTELNVTNLVNIAYPNEFNVRSFCPDAFFAIYAQYSDVSGVVTMNDNEYISTGYFCIKDGA